MVSGDKAPEAIKAITKSLFTRYWCCAIDACAVPVAVVRAVATAETSAAFWTSADFADVGTETAMIKSFVGEALKFVWCIRSC